MNDLYLGSELRGLDRERSVLCVLHRGRRLTLALLRQPVARDTRRVG